MPGMTEIFKTTSELKDAEGRRTTFVVRMSLEECNALLDAANAGVEELHKVPAALDWVLTRIVREQRALIAERIGGEEGAEFNRRFAEKGLHEVDPPETKKTSKKRR